MHSTNIKYLSQLIEPKIMNTCCWTEEELKGHLQLDQETAHQVVMQAMRNIVGRDIRWSQSQQPGRLRYQKTNYQNYRMYADSDLGKTAREVHEELLYYKEKDIKVQILDIPATMEPHGYDLEWLDYMLTDMLIETMDAMESIKRLERKDNRKAGIDALKGTPAWDHYGRPKQPLPENYDEVMRRWRNKEITAVVAMRLTGLKRTKFYELAKEWEGKS